MTKTKVLRENTKMKLEEAKRILREAGYVLKESDVRRVAAGSREIERVLYETACYMGDEPSDWNRKARTAAARDFLLDIKAILDDAENGRLPDYVVTGDGQTKKDAYVLLREELFDDVEPSPTDEEAIDGIVEKTFDLEPGSLYETLGR